MLTEMEEERQKIEISSKDDNLTIIAVNSRKVFCRLRKSLFSTAANLAIKEVEFFKSNSKLNTCKRFGYFSVKFSVKILNRIQLSFNTCVLSFLHVFMSILMAGNNN